MTAPARLMVALACSSFVALLGCGDGAQAELEHRRFLSESVTEDGAPRSLAGGTRLVLGFEATPSFYADAGCNDLFGEYEIESGRFVTLAVGSTLIFCEADLGAQEEWYIDFLDSSPTISIDGDELVLEGGGTRIEYLDEDVATADLETEPGR